MKFTSEVEIADDYRTVAEIWSNEAYFHRWQDGFQKKIALFGRKGEVGCKSEIFYNQGKSSMQLVETVLKNDLPESFSAKYEHSHMDNILNVHFMSSGEHQTTLNYEVDYIAFRGIMPRIMSFLFPGMFKRQVQKWLNQFKRFVEEEMAE